MRLGLLLVAATLLSAGCLGGPATPTEEATPTQTFEPTRTPGEFHPANTVSDRLDLRSLAESEIRVVATLPRKNNQTVFDRTYAAGVGNVSLPPTNNTTAAYHVEIYADGELRWSQRLHAFEVYEVLVHENGTVEVVGVAER